MQSPNSTFKQLFRYALVGLTTNGLGYLVYLLLTWLGVPPKLAMTVLYGVGVLLSYLGNRRYTFGDHDNFKESGIRFIMAYALGYMINLSLMILLIDHMGMPHQAVQALNIFITAVFIFIMLKFFVFKNSGNQFTDSQQKPTPTDRTRLESGADWLNTRLNAHAPLILGLSLMAWVLTTVYKAHRKFLWLDELATWCIARNKSFSGILTALSNNVDYNPPQYYALIRAFQTVIAHDALATRMPAIAGVGVLSLCLYRFIVHATQSRSAALVAAWFPLITPVSTFYAFEARPSAVVIGFAGLLMISWQAAIDPGRTGSRTGWLIGITLSLVGGMCHVYGILLFGPLALAELSRDLDRRKIDWPVWNSILIAALLLAYPLWQLVKAKASVPTGFAIPKWDILPDIYRDNLAITAIILLLFLALATLQNRGSTRSQKNSAKNEARTNVYAWIFCAGLLALPLISLCVAKLTHAPLFARYSLSAVAGFAALAGFMAARTRPLITLSALLFIALLIVWDFYKFYSGTGIQEPSSKILIPTWQPRYDARWNLLRTGTDQTSPIVIWSHIDFIQTYHYAPPDILKRLNVLTETGISWDRDWFSTSYELSKKTCGAPGRNLPAKQFLQENQHFLLVCYTDSEIWNSCDLSFFLKKGWTAKKINTTPAGHLYELNR